MRWSRSDTIFTGLMLSLLGLICTGINFNLNRNLGRNSSFKPIGIVKFKNHQVMRKYGDRFAWEEVNPQTDIYPYDTILTREKSDATVTLDQGLTFSIDPNTMIEIEGSDILLKSGSLKVDNTSGKNSTIKIADGTILNLEKGKATIQLSDDGLSVTVTEGKVEATKNGSKKIIDESESINFKDGKSTKQKTDLMGASPSNNSIIKTLDNGSNVTFKWKHLKPLQLTISHDPLLKKNKIITLTTDSSKKYLKSGLWYWRLSTPDNSNQSPIYSFKIIQSQRIKVYSPTNGTVIKVQNNKDLDKLSFRWANTNGDTQTLLLSKDPKLNRTILQRKTNTGALSIHNLMPGTYFWAVTSNESNAVTSKTSKFSIVSVKNNSVEIDRPEENSNNEVTTKKVTYPQPGKVKLISPTTSQTINSNNPYLYFKWTRATNANAYQFRISDTAKRSLLKAVTTNRLRYRLTISEHYLNRKLSWSISPVYKKNGAIRSKGKSSYKSLKIHRKNRLSPPLIKKIVVREAKQKD